MSMSDSECKEILNIVELYLNEEVIKIPQVIRNDLTTIRNKIKTALGE